MALSFQVQFWFQHAPDSPSFTWLWVVGLPREEARLGSVLVFGSSDLLTVYQCALGHCTNLL